MPGPTTEVLEGDVRNLRKLVENLNASLDRSDVELVIYRRLSGVLFIIIALLVNGAIVWNWWGLIAKVSGSDLISKDDGPIAVITPRAARLEPADALAEQRFEAADALTKQRFEAIEARTDDRFKAMNARFDRLEAMIARVSARP